MDNKSKLELYEKLKEERKISNETYAPMIVKIIVFGMVGIILSTALVIDDLGFSNTRKVVLKASAASGLTAFRPYYLVGDGNTGRVLILSAEL